MIANGIVLSSEVEFRMTTISQHKSAFERQLTEAVLIRRKSGAKLMNSKLEYTRCYIPKITVKIGDKEAKNPDIEKENNTKDIIRMMKNKWRRNELLEGEIETENPPKKRKIAQKRGPKSDSNGGDIFKGDSNGKNLSSNGEIKAHFLECDNIPEKDPQSVQKCDFSPKKDHIIDTNDSDDEKQAVDGEKPSTVSVPFGCGPSNITMGGRSPPNLIKT